MILTEIAIIILTSSIQNVLSENCRCLPVSANFNETVTEKADACPRCYIFQYSVYYKQDWISRLCVQKHNTSESKAHLYVVVKENYNLMSFHVPLTFINVSPYLEVCRSLCPVTSFPDYRNESSQNISVEISSSHSSYSIGFSMTLSTIHDFIIAENETRTVNVTPTMAHVLQYNMEKDARSVRIEATSEDDNCMLLAIQAAQCPIHDAVDSFELQGYYQTFTRQAGIDVTQKSFPKGQQYIVIFLMPTNEKCVKKSKHIDRSSKNQKKEVTITLVPAITDYDFDCAVYVTLGLYLVFWIISCFSCPRERRKYEGLSSTDPLMEQDASRLKFLIYISDVIKRPYKDLCERSKSYPRNIIVVGFFYVLPVIQFVVINQNIVKLTGDQDLCYYNFLCSHQALIFMDFNHIYSNIGYILLGILFLILVWRRSHLDSVYEGKVFMALSKHLGVPRNSGLLFAMGWALFVEGWLSASYHVCPSKTNFQFDTTFMFVIVILCILKIYQSRHPDLTPQSHSIWILFAGINLLGFLGAVEGGIAVWAVFSILHFVLMTYVLSCLYNTGRWKKSLPSYKCNCNNYQQYIINKNEAPCVCSKSFLFFVGSALANLGFPCMAKDVFYGYVVGKQWQLECISTWQ